MGGQRCLAWWRACETSYDGVQREHGSGARHRRDGSGQGRRTDRPRRRVQHHRQGQRAHLFDWRQMHARMWAIKEKAVLSTTCPGLGATRATTLMSMHGADFGNDARPKGKKRARAALASASFDRRATPTPARCRDTYWRNCRKWTPGTVGVFLHDSCEQYQAELESKDASITCAKWSERDCEFVIPIERSRGEGLPSAKKDICPPTHGPD